MPQSAHRAYGFAETFVLQHPGGQVTKNGSRSASPRPSRRPRRDRFVAVDQRIVLARLVKVLLKVLSCEAGGVPHALVERCAMLARLASALFDSIMDKMT